jgi:hypothetical protein
MSPREQDPGIWHLNAATSHIEVIRSWHEQRDRGVARSRSWSVSRQDFASARWKSGWVGWAKQVDRKQGNRVGNVMALLLVAWATCPQSPAPSQACGLQRILFAIRPDHLQGAPTQSPGVLVGPLPVRKCRQMPSKEHMELGWVVRWVLSTPPGHTPRLGGAAVSCQYLPCSFALALRAPGGPSIGGQSPPPAPR